MVRGGKRRSGRGGRGGRGGGGGGGGGGGAGGGGGGGGGGGRGGGGRGGGGGGGRGTGSGGGGSSGGGGGGSGSGIGGQGQQQPQQQQQHQSQRQTPTSQQLLDCDAWRAKFPNAPKFPNWAELLRRDVPIFDLDYEAILAAMYALCVSAEGDCYLCVPSDPGIAPGIAPAALGACESAPLGTVPAQALHTFTLDSGASRCFFRDSTTVTPLPAPVPVSLADPSGDPVLARSFTVLPCPAVPSGELSGLHLPSFSTNLVSNAVLQDAGVDTFTPGQQRVAICTCSQTGRHLATFARAPGSSLYTLTSASCSTPLSPQLHASAQSAPLGTVPAQALHTFTLDSGASRCFFRDSTTVTPLPAPVPVSLADPSGDPVLARSFTVLPCPAVPSGELSGLHLPSFSTNLVSNAVLQDAGVDTFTPGRQRVTICTCSQTGRHLATFGRAPGSSLYTLTSASCSTPLSPQLHASAQVATQCECRRLSHDTLLWHHRLGHPSLPRLRSMHSRVLVFGLPRSLPSLPPSPAPPCIPCVEGRQRATPHSSSFPQTEAPLQTLHLDVWGLARVRGQGHERYFLLVVDDYTRYTTVFPLQRKADVPDVLIPWIRATCLQLRERFQPDFPVLRLHSDRGGEFSSDLLEAFCAEHGIRQTFTLPASPQKNGVAERRIGLVMEVARTSMIHAAAPHFLWPFAVRFTTPPRAVSLHLRMSPLTSRSPFTTSSPTALLLAPPPPPLFLARGPPQVDPFPAPGPAPSGVSQVDPPAPAPFEVTGDSGHAGSGAVPRGAELGGAESGGAKRVEPGGASSRGTASGGAEPVCAEPGSAASGGELPEGSEAAVTQSPWSSRLRPRVPLTSQQLHDWYGRRRLPTTAAQGSPTGDSSPGVAGPGGARTGSTGAARAGGGAAGGAGAAEG
ncbi:unnamed protein product, partial [Closterium sp. NIES-53]